MKYTKLIVVAASNLDTRINTLFGLRDLVSKGKNVVFCNVSQITYDYPAVENRIEGIKSFSFSTRDDFERFVRFDYDKSLYLVYMNFCKQTSFIFRVLSKYNKSIACCSNGVLPLHARSTKQRLSSISYKKVSKYFYSKVLSIVKKSSLFNAEVLHLNTCRLSEADYKTDEQTLFVPFNSTDFVQSQMCSSNLLDKPYIVFIDMYIPFHPDNSIAGFVPISPKLYYPLLNSFFERIENKTGCTVVIAAHPVASKYKEYNYFEGRPVYFGETATLIKYSEGVIDHCSTAISYAILFKKPIITVVSKDMESAMPEIYDYAKQYSQYFNSRFVLMDDAKSEIEFKEIDESLYEKYKYDYLTNLESEHLPNYSILISIMEGCSISLLKS